MHSAEVCERARGGTRRYLDIIFCPFMALVFLFLFLFTSLFSRPCEDPCCPGCRGARGAALIPWQGGCVLFPCPLPLLISKKKKRKRSSYCWLGPPWPQGDFTLKPAKAAFFQDAQRGGSEGWGGGRDGGRDGVSGSAEACI